MIPNPIAIFNTAQNPEAAKAVLNWWLSKDGQPVIVTKGWMHSARDEVQSPNGVPDAARIPQSSPVLDWDKLANETEQIKDYR